MKTILIFCSVIILLTSCEDVIKVELNYMEPKLVIEGVITDSDNQCIIKLSKTADYFNQEINPTVSDAVITLTDNAGTIVKFNEIVPGIYMEESVQVKPDINYTLNILSEGDEYVANATIPQKVTIDSLTYQYNSESIFYEVGYVVSCHFSDPEELRNFYRLKTYNISDRTKGKNSKDIYNDDLFNGNNVELSWSYDVYQQFDTVVVELYTLDVQTYDYYKTLFSISGGAEMMSMTTPANPNTNINNGALGYFGAYTISRDTIIISPSN
ncbi:MAG: DUF4249 domain-containing protein [Bacteroidetes bacterium]|nr:MAG: DUF4249 domain-containing protein [Bacteroidota bacterium]